MITVLEIGDWSKDGHNQSELVTVEHNLLSDEELQHAHDAGCRKLGFDFIKEVAREYEEPYISKEYVERFADFGADITQYIYLDEEEGSLIPVEGTEGYAKLWLTVAWIGRPDLRWQDPVDLSHKALKIGGYGLFH